MAMNQSLDSKTTILHEFMAVMKAGPLLGGAELADVTPWFPL